MAQTQAPVEPGAPSRAGAQPPGPRGRPGSTTTTGMIVKIALLGLVLAIAIFGAFPLIEQQQWLGLALLVLVTAVIFWVYLSPKRIPAKYLIPGTLFLLAFQVIYRSLLILPYAMPAFAMLLLWRDMFNTDFGLINRMFGTEINWFGKPVTAMIAVLLVQLWMGYPYMFLVATGALQSIPGDLKEAASVDGAKPVYALRTIVFPLLLVALAPLMIASFAFNFNNFNAIYMVSEGGPFPPDNPQLGATDILITYTYRLAFGAQGAQYGFAAAVSIFIFLIVAVISIVGFRRSRALEEVN